MANPSNTVISGHNQGMQVESNFGHISSIFQISPPSSKSTLENLGLYSSLPTPLSIVPKPFPSSTVPFRRDPDFIERDGFADIVRKFSEPGSRIALVGLGGVG
jgi:hypothetical protein